jgi:23S rRNA (cytosine1962-C5)-methyltransferase
MHNLITFAALRKQITLSTNKLDIILKPGKEISLMRRHPWVFSGAIAKLPPKIDEGQLVRVLDSKNNFLALGHYQIGSIAIRVFAFEDVTIDQDYWKSKIESAYKLRSAVGLTENEQTNTFRLIHGEGDELPGMIIDFYNGTAVTQFHSIGLYLVKDDIINALQQVMGDRLSAIYDKSESTMPFKAPVKPINGYLWGESKNNIVSEHGNLFHIDWCEGQKTGFFIDQRENRKLVGEFSSGKDVLNMFCYTGGFSVYAIRGGASSVHSVDSSKKAIELTNENVSRNFGDNHHHEALCVDAFSYMNDIKDKYDLIVLDPPAFAKHNEALDNALQGYKRLNQKAFEQIRSGGILFTFSCSQVVTKENFRKSVFAAAANSKRKISILHQLTQPSDHPVSIYHPEGEYLKGLVLYVE